MLFSIFEEMLAPDTIGYNKKIGAAATLHYLLLKLACKLIFDDAMNSVIVDAEES